MLGDELTKTGITVNHASGDDDLPIVHAALEAAKDYPMVLIGEDTDLLVLALHHFTNEKALYFTYEPTQSQQLAEVWNIGYANRILGKICHGILVIHNFSGCDTTSRIHSVRKPAVLEKYRKSNEFQKLTTIFLDLSAKKGDTIDAGEQLMLSITGATKKEKTMDEKRLADYYKKLGNDLSHLDPPQMPRQNTEKRSITLFKVGADMIYHLHNGDGKCRMGCVYLCK